MLFNGSAQAIAYRAQYWLTISSYFCFQTPLDTAYDDLDNADSKTALVEVAAAYLQQAGDARLVELADRLQV